MIDFIAPLLAIDGYGHSAQNLVLALDKLGVDVRFVPHDWLIDKFSKPRLLELAQKPGRSDTTTGIVYHLPPTLKHYRDKYKKLIAFTMWETTKLPPLWVASLNYYADTVLVPSEFCKKVFEESGVERPIYVVPLGIDLEQYKYYDRPKRDDFKFLITGKMDDRKNWRAVVKAFIQEFDEQDVKLIVKTRSGSGIKIDGDPRIQIISEDYTGEEMADLYNSCDCFVYPSKGEGYGLPPREAMATGLPVIMTSYGPLIERVDPFTYYPVTISGMEDVDYPTKHLISLENVDLGQWAVPDFEELKKMMRRVYNKKAEAKIIGKTAALSIKRNADPKNGALVIKRIV